ncbi:MAG: tetratricopeptide repeat protein, partial [Patescibacteria group bacterium]
DKGLIAANSSLILAKVGSYLDEYRPDMVVAMMGVNDIGAHIAYDKPSSWKIVLFVRSLKTYKLARLLGLRLVTNFMKSAGPSARNDAEYLALGREYYHSGRLLQAEECFMKSIALNPRNDGAYIGLGLVYHDLWQFRKAEESFNKAIGINFNNDMAYVELGRLFHERGQLQKAEQSLNRALELNPGNDLAYLELGRLYHKQELPQREEENLIKAVEINPRNEWAYREIGRLYYERGQFQQAENYFKKAIASNAGNKAQFYGALGTLYGETKQFAPAQECLRNADQIRLSAYNLTTSDNFRKLKNILNKRNIRLVCVQYPMRDIGPLKKVFRGDDGGILFADNEKIFKDAVKGEGYKAYFNDMFGGDFGHCTDKGNRLLAVNIANIVLAYVLDR